MSAHATDHRPARRRRAARAAIAFAALPLAMAAYPASAASTPAPTPVAVPTAAPVGGPTSVPTLAAVACQQKIAAAGPPQAVDPDVVKRCLAVGSKVAPVAVPVAGQPNFTG